MRSQSVLDSNLQSGHHATALEAELKSCLEPKDYHLAMLDVDVPSQENPECQSHPLRSLYPTPTGIHQSC